MHMEWTSCKSSHDRSGLHGIKVKKGPQGANGAPLWGYLKSGLTRTLTGTDDLSRFLQPG
jgi:hypothetical protein